MILCVPTAYILLKPYTSKEQSVLCNSYSCVITTLACNNYSVIILRSNKSAVITLRNTEGVIQTIDTCTINNN